MAPPNLPVLVFDGGCGVCTRVARWAERRLPEQVGAAVVPWQLSDLRALRLSPTDVANYVWWVDADGRRRRGHRAVAAALRAIGGRWRIAARLLELPPISWLAAASYRLIAKNRHHLRRLGITPACANGRC